MRRLRPSVLRAAIAALACLCMTAPALGQPDPEAVAAQQRIEAAYLFKFGGYITWPDKVFSGPTSPIVIGVAGADTVAEDLETLADGRNINGRPVAVRRIHAGDPLDGVHILFVAAGANRGDAMLDAARGNPTLAVTEGADGLSRGAEMTFVLVDDRVRFDVSLDPVQQSGLKLSALLLSVAHAVDGNKP